MASYKITVLKRMVNQDLVDEYGQGVVLPCDKVQEGQEWVLSGSNKPEDFCSWAWADIQRDMMIVRYGGNIPWIKQPGTHIVSCTDGLRPVVFKVERLQE
jgi:uncharacterized repeat protein (TIGR04076 family)